MFIEIIPSVELVWAMALFEFNNGANPMWLLIILLETQNSMNFLYSLYLNEFQNIKVYTILFV